MSIQTKTTMILMLSAAMATATAGGININEAGAEKLQQINGVGDARASAIVDYREANGSFDSVDELTEVDGIGEVTLNENRDQLTVGAAE